MLDRLELSGERFPAVRQRLRVPCPPAVAPNDRWSMDFRSDRLASGQAFRVLALVDNVTRVSPRIEADLSLTGRRLAELLEEAVAR